MKMLVQSAVAMETADILHASRPQFHPESSPRLRLNSTHAPSSAARHSASSNHRTPTSSYGIGIDDGGTSVSSGISIAFRDVFETFKSGDLALQSSSCKRDAEILRAKSEKLLNSEANLRPRSKNKSFIYPVTYENGTKKSIYREELPPAFTPVDAERNGVLTPISSTEQDEKEDEENESNNADIVAVYTHVKKTKKHRRRPKSSHRRRLKATSVKQAQQSVQHSENKHPNVHTIHVSSERSSKSVPDTSHNTQENSHFKLTSNGHVVKNYKLHQGDSNNKSNSRHEGDGKSDTVGLDDLQANVRPATLHVHDSKELRVHSRSNSKSAGSSANREGSPRLVLSHNTNKFHLHHLAFPDMNIQGSSLQSKVLKQRTEITANTLKVTSDATIRAIYGATGRSKTLEEVHRLKKVFLSDKQSGTIKENGEEFPCAPPATPTPDMMKKYEYIPSMNDIRSQRAVKARLQSMEKEKHRKLEKQKEARAKMEKQCLKEREKELKARQRIEIYALNKVMTELENKRFEEFCKAKGLNS